MDLSNRKKIKEVNAHLPVLFLLFFLSLVVKLLHFYFPFIFYFHPAHVRVCTLLPHLIGTTVCANFFLLHSFQCVSCGVYRVSMSLQKIYICQRFIIFIISFFLLLFFREHARIPVSISVTWLAVFFCYSIRHLAHIKDMPWLCNAFEI